MYQHPHPGLGFEQPRGYGKPHGIEVPPPVITGNGGKMSVPEERPKRDQLTIVRRVAKCATNLHTWRRFGLAAEILGQNNRLGQIAHWTA